MSPRLAAAGGITAVAAVVVAGAMTRPGAPSRTDTPATTRPVTRVQLVCPGLDGSASAPVQITVADTGRLLDSASAPAVRVTLTPLPVGSSDASSSVAASSPTVDPVSTTTFTSRLPATVVTAVGPGAGNVVASQHQLVADGALRGLVSAPCLAPATDTWITGADGRVGRSDVLVVSNAGSAQADVTVSAWSVTGRVDLPKLQSLTVPAGQAVELDLADYAPDAALLGLHLHADSGRVAAAVRDNQTSGLSPAGTDWLAPTQPPADHLVVPGYQPGDGPRLLVVTNPGHDDATVRLRLLTRDRAFVPAGHPDVVVPPGRSTFVDLSTSLGGAAAAAELTSDRPVLAAGMSQLTASGRLSEIGWLPAAAALDGPAVLPDNTRSLDGDAVLALTALAPATVRLVGRSGRSDVVQVAAGRTVSVDLRSALDDDGSGPVVVVPVSGSVWVSRSIVASGAHGPLLTAAVPATLPAPIRLPPVRENLRVAVR